MLYAVVHQVDLDLGQSLHLDCTELDIPNMVLVGLKDFTYSDMMPRGVRCASRPYIHTR